jgi:tetraacyldisaccharide 4'-kinase
VSGLLAPLGALFGTVAAARAELHRRRLLPQARLAGAVISVGNLSVGGSGKTPLTAWIAASLRDAGLAVAVLSRGYGGSFRGEALVVSDGASLMEGAETAGDEPVMLARDLPGVVVAVGPRRDVVGHAVEARFGRRVHVLDDGFQHLRLHRDLDLVCVDAADMDERCLPAGRLREFPSALSRAHVVLLSGSHPILESSLAGQVTLHRWSRRIVGCADLVGAKAPTPRRALLLAGIARPERFACDAAAIGIEVLGTRFHPDHHRFSDADVAAAVEAARLAGAEAVLTTAKDAVRIRAASRELPLLVLRIEPAIEDAGGLRARLLEAARGAVT